MTTGTEELPLSQTMKSAMERAEKIARSMGNDVVDEYHVFLAIMAIETGAAYQILCVKLSMTYERCRTQLLKIKPAQAHACKEPLNPSDLVNEIMGKAKEYATKQGAKCVSTKHVLRTLLMEDKSVQTIRELLNQLNKDVSDVSSEVFSGNTENDPEDWSQEYRKTCDKITDVQDMIDGLKKDIEQKKDTLAEYEARLADLIANLKRLATIEEGPST
ncbi:MAG: hypothetical protein MRY49_00785 [Candidatus Pacebacteria bacterium]|nr:hypothetical protein [Candidatus Paceibacterota bacterium]